MPTVLRQYGLRFVIFTDDHPPPHVHVAGRGALKITLDPPHRVIDNKGMSKADVARALNVVRTNSSDLIELWTRYHG